MCCEPYAAAIPDPSCRRQPQQSNRRLAHYCLDLAELFGTDRIVPVVIFLHPGALPTQLILGGDAHRYLKFQYFDYALLQ
jgi:hypothetical protein